MSFGADDYIDNAATDPAKALQEMGGAKAILASLALYSAQASITTPDAGKKCLW
jgi:propanol-preferring alcohol dehydrogenase